MIRAAETSVSRLCVVPLQDVLGLGSEGAHECAQPPGRKLVMALCTREFEA